MSHCVAMSRCVALSYRVAMPHHVAMTPCFAMSHFTLLHCRKERPSLNILDDVGMKDFKASLYEVMKRLQSKQANLYSVQVQRRQAARSDGYQNFT